MIQVGKTYYFIVHVYHHFIGEVVEITGKKECTIKNVKRIQSCRRGWDAFFKEGIGNDTSFTIWPDDTEISNWFICVPWHHE